MRPAHRGRGTGRASCRPASDPANWPVRAGRRTPRAAPCSTAWGSTVSAGPRSRNGTEDAVQAGQRRQTGTADHERHVPPGTVPARPVVIRVVRRIGPPRTDGDEQRERREDEARSARSPSRGSASAAITTAQNATSGSGRWRFQRQNSMPTAPPDWRPSAHRRSIRTDW